MNKESSIKQLKRIKQEMTHADDVNALDFAIRYMENKALKQIRAEVEGINPWALAFAASEYRDTRPQIVARVKRHILEIIDKYREG